MCVVLEECKKSGGRQNGGSYRDLVSYAHFRQDMRLFSPRSVTFQRNQGRGSVKSTALPHGWKPLLGSPKLATGRAVSGWLAKEPNPQRLATV